jgi:hypothetical protein
MTMTRTHRWAVGAVAAVAVATPSAVALADVIANDLDGVVDTSHELMTLVEGGAPGTTQMRIIPVDNDGRPGCNLTAGSSLVVRVNTSDAAIASVSPSELTFTSCDDTRTVTVTPGTVGGPAEISLGQVFNSSGSTFSLAPARFRVVVAESTPPNTPPTVVVTGVENRNEYEHGTVPAAGCLVTDPEEALLDSTTAASPTLSQVTGPFSHAGLGLQTASCSFTDGGGLTTTVGATYGIVDTDFVANELDDDTPDTSHETLRLRAGGAGGTARMYLYLGGDDPNGCNILPGTSVNLSVNSGDESVAKVSPSSIAFTDCEQRTPIQITPVAAGGPAEIFLGLLANDTGMKFSLATARFNVFVEPGDDQAPTLGVPNPIVVDATTPAGANVSYAATASDNMDVNPSVSCSPPSGAKFAIGTTTVNCTASDAAGNSSAKSFTVRVKGAPEQIADLVDKLRGIKGLVPLQPALHSYLQNLADCVLRRDKTRACLYADYFIAGVRTAIAKRWIGAPVGNDLIANVTRIKAVVACG